MADHYRQNTPVPLRRAGAPRLIDQDPSRCVPWDADSSLIYEHFHRYFWARELVADARVLDAGSGEGFGPAILADAASEVVGVDIDSQAVNHAELNWSSESLQFIEGDVRDMSELDDDSFDIVVAFNLLGSIDRPDRAMGEIKRLLRPGGYVLLSGPASQVDYSGPSSGPDGNSRLISGSLQLLTSRSFRNARFFSQRTIEGSRIEAFEEANGRSTGPIRIERHGTGWHEAGNPSPQQVLAVASDDELPDVPDYSTLADFGLDRARNLEEAVSAERDTATNLRGQVSAKEKEVEALNQQLVKLAESERNLKTRVNLASSRLVAEATQEKIESSRVAREAKQRAVAAEIEATARSAELARLQASMSWRIFQRAAKGVLSLFGGSGGFIPRAARVITSRALAARDRAGDGVGQQGADEARFEFELPTSPSPLVSIVIPVHDGPEITRQCLTSILYSIDDLAYEVVVVDDRSNAETQAALARIGGIKVIRNSKNLGFLKSVNVGVSRTRGKYVVLLNNDTEPQPGWLRALVDCAEGLDDVGAVVPQLLYGDIPEHTLQEAGGIVWRDGTPWNFGNRGDRQSAEFKFTREVDYGSAAALLVRRDAWDTVGGFDERFSPAYWEDVDLCFALRKAGWRVFYEPTSIVIHLEGESMGTDPEGKGLKRYQSINKEKFVKKWRATLDEHPGNACRERALLASNWRRSPTAMIFDHDLPTPDRDAGSLRMMGIIKVLTDLGWRVIFVPDSGSERMPYAGDLRRMGVQVLNGNYSVAEHLSAVASDLRLVVLSRPYVAARYLHFVREYAPQATVVFDTVDLHHVRETQRAELAESNTKGIRLAAESFRELETAMCRSTDLTLVVSEAEARVVGEFSDKPVRVVPVANRVWDVAPAAEERTGVLFVGGFAHPPNADAAIQLATIVMPKVWESHPDTLLTIVGADPPASIKGLRGPNVAVTGWVDDLSPFLTEARVMAAPIRYGAGVKGKVTQAMAAGLPVVTTPAGTEGINALPGEEILVGGDPAAMAAAIGELVSDDALWTCLSEGGRRAARRSFSLEVQQRAIEELVDEILKPAESPASPTELASGS